MAQPEPRKTLAIEVADPANLNVVVVPEDPEKVGPPVAETDYRYADRS
jgi:hypothetical protein